MNYYTKEKQIAYENKKEIWDKKLDSLSTELQLTSTRIANSTDEEYDDLQDMRHELEMQIEEVWAKLKELYVEYQMSIIDSLSE